MIPKIYDKIKVMPYWFDGNNLIGQSAVESRERPRMLKSFLSTLAEYHKSGGGRFLVYFDGDDSNRSILPSGIRVRYSAPLTADDAIIGRLHEIRSPSEVIVVTNDFELQSRCRAARAKVLNWHQFASKMKSRKKRPEIDSQQKVDVDEWMEYFGIKDSNQKQ